MDYTHKMFIAGVERVWFIGKYMCVTVEDRGRSVNISGFNEDFAMNFKQVLEIKGTTIDKV